MLASPLVASDLSRRFGPRWALVRVDLQVPPGGSLLLLGPNGSGKTTLLRCLATALRPHHGTVLWGGRSMWEERAELRAGIALWSHATHLYEDLTAHENLAVWARMGGMSADVPALLDRVGLSASAHISVRGFSAGMRRRLSLARVLLKQPALALLDEPYTNLDADGRALVGHVIDELRGRGASVIVSTHEPELARRHCDAAVLLQAGEVAWRGAPDAAPVIGVEA